MRARPGKMAVVPRLAAYHWPCRLMPSASALPPSSPWQRRLLSLIFARQSSRASKRMLKLGIGPDGKPLPQPNKKRIHPRMYPVLVVNQDGSTYTMRHRTPLRILALPLDPATLTPEEREERERARRAARERVYVEEDVEEDDWDQDHYRRLIDR
ncbi:39S ribosomal protein L55, mitochondrial [Geodia barretti]|uniref:39S ribosomal protein L55, mitochondrial n=1 Tax=Geodia barretti TaxID=519541 RepID=A0AA35XI72_GEOBA|nr:39S ribosomal protein L55, mitochondrial [Geodia barretti]